jgi:hypothetical protein
MSVMTRVDIGFEVENESDMGPLLLRLYEKLDELKAEGLILDSDNMSWNGYRVVTVKGPGD